MAITVSSLVGALKTPPFGSGSWALAFLFMFLAANLKNLPFVWHLRFLRTLTARLISPRPSRTSTPNLTPDHLFHPAITSSRSPFLECDYNIHKSNSTYFSDLDFSRTNLILLLFRSKVLSHGPDSAGRDSTGKLVPILGGVQCSFKKEIKPYQGYEMWTRVLSWDEKWIYLVSHFVVKGKVRPGRYLLQGGGNSDDNNKGEGNGKMEQKYVFASSIARYVFKSGRKTVPPSKPLVECNLVPEVPSGIVSGEATSGAGDDNQKSNESERESEIWQKIEEQRKKNLEIAQLRGGGWDTVHELFSSDDDSEVLALGRYTDMLWR